MSYATLQTKVFDVVKQISGLAAGQIIPVNDNGPEPTGLYVTYTFDVIPSGESYISDPNSSTRVVTHKQQYDGTLTLNWYREGAKAAAIAFWSALRLDNNVLYLRSKNFSVRQIPAIQDLTFLEDSRAYVERCELKVRFFTVDSWTETISTFDEVRGGLDFDNSDYDIDFDFGDVTP